MPRIVAIIELEDRIEYYEALRSAHPKHGGDTMPFIFFVAKALEKTLDRYLIIYIFLVLIMKLLFYIIHNKL